MRKKSLFRGVIGLFAMIVSAINVAGVPAYAGDYIEVKIQKDAGIDVKKGDCFYVTCEPIDDRSKDVTLTLDAYNIVNGKDKVQIDDGSYIVTTISYDGNNKSMDGVSYICLGGFSSAESNEFTVAIGDKSCKKLRSSMDEILIEGEKYSYDSSSVQKEPTKNTEDSESAEEPEIESSTQGDTAEESPDQSSSENDSNEQDEPETKTDNAAKEQSAVNVLRRVAIKLAVLFVVIIVSFGIVLILHKIGKI